MTQVKSRTEEGNFRISRFMGYTYPDMNNPVWKDSGEHNYHEDPRKLFPILEKICRLKIKYQNTDEWYSPCPRTFGMINEETGKIMVRLEAHSLFEADTLIEATWMAITDFLETYPGRRFPTEKL